MIELLKNRGIVSVSGEDSASFLQSQFSNDILNIKDHEVQINAYCQHQGKVIAIIWVFKQKDKFYLSISLDLKDTILAKLTLFKMMSKVNIEDLSDTLFQFGIIDEKIDGMKKITSNLSIFVTTNKLFKKESDFPQWEIACIEALLPEIYLITSEKFIPQELNLDIDEIGVSFTKGCYPGQEVVARMHYLGKPKRRLFHFSSKYEATIGDIINVKDSQSLKSSGVVTRVVKIDENFHFLGTFEVKHINGSPFLNNDVDRPLTVLNAK